MSPLMKTSKLTTQTKIMILASLVIFSSALMLITKDASAGKYKLKCKGPYQVVQGNLISTPPCQNAYIAKVARSYGHRVTAKQVRNNFHKKLEICDHIGHDIRISDYCPKHRNVSPSVGR